MLILSISKHLDRGALQRQGSVYGFKYAYDFFSFASAGERLRTSRYGLQEMPALILQRFADLDPRTQNVAVANLEVVFAIAERLGGHRPHTLFVDPDLLEAVEVVEDNATIAPDDDNLTRFLGIGPADVNVPNDVVWITERDEPDVITAVPEDLDPDGTHPLRDAVDEEVEDRDVVGSKVP
jgi:hypothetical protein